MRARFKVCGKSAIVAASGLLPQAGVRGCCPTPRSGVRAVAQGASPGFDFTGERSREAAAELQPAAPLGLCCRPTPNPSAYALGYLLTPLRGWGNTPVSAKPRRGGR